MNRRKFIRDLSIPLGTVLAGCGGSSSDDGSDTPTLPETVEEAKEESSETATSEPTTTPESKPEPIDWVSRAKDGTNSRYAPSQSFAEGEYSTTWEGQIGNERKTARDVVAGEGRLFVLDPDELAAFSGGGEQLWRIREHDIESLAYANGSLAAFTWSNDLLILSSETGKRTGLIKDFGMLPHMTEVQTTESGFYAYLLEQANVNLKIVNGNDGELVFDEQLDGFDTGGSIAATRLLAEGKRLYLIGHEPEEYKMKVQIRNVQSGGVESEFTSTWVDENEMDSIADSTLVGDQIISAMAADEDLAGNGKIASGLISYSVGGSQNWVANDLLGTKDVRGVCSNGNQAFLIAPEKIVAVDASDGSTKWEYSNREKFAKDAGIVTDGMLLIPDHSASSGIRIHAIDTESGDARRTQLVAKDDQPISNSEAAAHLRPASEGLYTMGQTLRHVRPDEAN